VEYRDETIIAALEVPSDVVAATIRREFTELKRREKLFRGDRPFPELEGKTVIVVDDGIATGSTMRAAFRAVQLKHPKTVIVAAPVASSEAVDTLRRDGAEVITVMIAERMFAIGEFYRDFRQTTDEEVKSLLDRASTGPGDSRTAAA
jgi:predicted phosphoribosyltransferase